MTAPRHWHGPLPAPDWFNAPRIVRRDLLAPLTPAEFKILYLLMDEAYAWHTGHAYLSQRQIGKETDLARSTVQAALAELERIGLVERIANGQPGDHEPDGYRLLISMDKRYAGASTGPIVGPLTGPTIGPDPARQSVHSAGSVPDLYNKEGKKGTPPDRKKWSTGTYAVCAVCLCRPCAC